MTWLLLLFQWVTPYRCDKIIIVILSKHVRDFKIRCAQELEERQSLVGPSLSSPIKQKGEETLVFYTVQGACAGLVCEALLDTDGATPRRKNRLAQADD